MDALIWQQTAVLEALGTAFLLRGYLVRMAGRAAHRRRPSSRRRASRFTPENVRAWPGNGRCRQGGARGKSYQLSAISYQLSASVLTTHR
jgi:hypothetical protein